MPCYRTLTMSQAAVGEVPLQDAVYVASTDKIYGISGVYVIQLNATTGSVESSVRITSPVNGPARLCYHLANDTLYASVWNAPDLQYYSLTQPNRDIYPINPATMTVGARLDVPSLGYGEDDFTVGYFFGPRWLGSSGSRLFVQWANDNMGYIYFWFDPTNLASKATNSRGSSSDMLAEQCAVTPTQIFFPAPDSNAVQFAPHNFNVNGDWDICTGFGAGNPISCDYCSFDTLVYCVDGIGNMYRINDPTIDDVDTIAIPADAIVPVPNPNPCRIRWNIYDGLLYMPCMTDNAIVMYDPNLVAWYYKGGFENPVDCVFTPDGKKFAVQNSPEQPLKEITPP